jgi:hypothetical protein
MSLCEMEQQTWECVRREHTLQVRHEQASVAWGGEPDLCDVQLGLQLGEPLHQLPGQVAGAQAVLEAVMRGAREH